MGSRRRLALTFALSAAIVIATHAAPASANGRYPTAQYVIVGPGAASTHIALLTTFGVLASEDSGKTFHYLCEDALGYGGTSLDVPIAIDSEARILVGLYNSTYRTENDHCSAAPIPSLDGQFVADLDVNAKSGAVIASTATGFLGDTNYLYRAGSGAGPFTRLGVGRKDVQFDSVELAPSNDLRVFATGLDLSTSPRTLRTYRSDDGGTTLVETTLVPQDEKTVGLFVAAIDPSNPDTVYLRVAGPRSDGKPGRSTKLVRSDDAGATWQVVAQSTGEMLGFALGDDGNTLFYGGPDDGLVRSRDRGKTFEHIGDAHVLCLRWHAGELYVCGTNETDHFALAHSCDMGSTLRPMLGFFGGISGIYPCPASTVEGSSCKERLDGIHLALSEAGTTTDLPADPTCDGDAIADAVADSTLADVSPDTLTDGDRGDADGNGDAGSDSSNGGETTVGNESSGCGCSLRGAASSALGVSPVFALFAAASMLRRRRR